MLLLYELVLYAERDHLSTFVKEKKKERKRKEKNRKEPVENNKTNNFFYKGKLNPKKEKTKKTNQKKKKKNKKKQEEKTQTTEHQNNQAPKKKKRTQKNHATKKKKKKKKKNKKSNQKNKTARVAPRTEERSARKLTLLSVFVYVVGKWGSDSFYLGQAAVGPLFSVGCAYTILSIAPFSLFPAIVGKTGGGLEVSVRQAVLQATADRTLKASNGQK